MDRARSLASGTFYLTLMQASQYAVAFAFYAIIARVLTPGEVGCFSLLIMLLAVFNTLSLLALNSAVIKYVSENLGRGDEEYATASSEKAFKLILSVSLPALAFGFSASPAISAYVGTGVPEVLSILTSAFILNLTSYCGAIMYGYSMFREVSLQNVLYTSSSRFAGLLLAFLGFRVLGLSLGFLTGSIITFLYSIAALKGKIRRSGKHFPSAELLRFSMPVYGANVINLLQSWMDVAVLSSIAGLTAAGTYYIAVSSIAPLSILWQPLSSALFPTLSWINGSGNREEILNLHRRVLRIATAVILPLSFALASVSHTALSIVYGEKYAEASLPFTILALSAILSAYASIYSAELQSVGKTKPIFIAGVASTTVYMLLLATTTGLLGQVGAASARAMMTVAGFSILYREVGMRLPENLKRSALMAAFIASALTPIELFLQIDLRLKASIEALAFAAVLLPAFKLARPLNGEELNYLKLTLLKTRRFIFE